MTVLSSMLLLSEREEVAATTILFWNDAQCNKPLKAVAYLNPPHAASIFLYPPHGSGYQLIVNERTARAYSYQTDLSEDNIYGEYDEVLKLSNPAMSYPGMDFSEFRQDGLGNGIAYVVRIDIYNLFSRTTTGYAGFMILEARCFGNQQHVPIKPSVKASHLLSLSTSFPQPLSASLYDEHDTGLLALTPPDTTEYYYKYAEVRGEFLTKWNIIDTEVIKRAERVLIVLSTILGLGIGLIVQGTIAVSRAGKVE